MGTNIEWTDYTLSPGLYGCEKVSPACTNCYAMSMAARLERMGQDQYAGTTEGGQWTGRVTVDFDRIGPAFDKLPKRKPARVFVTSMSDLFHKDVPFEFIDRVFDEMEARPHLTFQVLTKRAERMRDYSRRRSNCGLSWPANVWAGVTVEDQKRADKRIPYLLQVPAAVRFLSVEPMVGAVDLTMVRWADYPDAGVRFDVLGGRYGEPGRWAADAGGAVSWVICGGESGPNARPMHPAWARAIRDQCVEAGVAFHFKQWGAWAPWHEDGRLGDITGNTAGFFNLHGVWYCGEGIGVNPFRQTMVKVGKKRAGRLLDGRTHDGFPGQVTP